MDDTTQPNAHLSPHARRVQQLAASAAARRDGLVDDAGRVEQLTRMVDAWGDDMLPMTRAEVAAAAGLSDDAGFDARFDLLVSFGAVQQHRRKSSTDRYVPSPLLLVGATLLADLAARSAVDRLVELIVVALDRVDDPDTPIEELLAIARTLTRLINVIAADINHQVDYGTAADVIEVRPSARAQRQVTRVADLATQLRVRDGAALQLLRPLADAADAFVGACDRLVERLTREVVAGGLTGLLAMLTPEAVDAACRTTQVPGLARLVEDQPFDRHRPVVAVHGLHDAVGLIGRPPIRRRPPRPPDPDGALDIGTTVAAQARRREARERARRQSVQRALAGRDEVVVVDEMWPAPLGRLVDALAVTDDPTLPVAADVGARPHVDADADVAVTHALRLRRLDTSHMGDAPVLDPDDVRLQADDHG